jgi:hypothetical protein
MGPGVTKAIGAYVIERCGCDGTAGSVRLFHIHPADANEQT